MKTVEKVADGTRETVAYTGVMPGMGDVEIRVHTLIDGFRQGATWAEVGKVVNGCFSAFNFAINTPEKINQVLTASKAQPK